MVRALAVGTSVGGKAMAKDKKKKHDPKDTGADAGKLYRHLGWKPTTSLDEGLAKQVEWQRSLI